MLRPLRRIALLLIALVSAASAPSLTATPEQQKGVGPLKVGVVRLEWKDPARDRSMPVKAYYPEEVAGPFPVIVFSHGLGGTRETYEYLGSHWASHGYVSVHLQHLGSDDAVWRDSAEPASSMVRSAMDPRNAIDRGRDVHFALDQLAAFAKQKDSPLAGRLDLTRVGVAGHSFGAWTTLAVAGQSMPRGGPLFLDPRVRAAVAMSAPTPQALALGAGAGTIYGGIKIPIFHMTGTEDVIPPKLAEARGRGGRPGSARGSRPLGGSAADRRIPYDHIDKADQYLVTFQGGDHMVFSGRPLGAERAAKDAEFQALIRWGTTVFWDAYLKDDAASKAWLTGGGFAAALGEAAKLEEKIRR